MTRTRQAAAQRGIATLLILIFIGIALTVAVLGAVNHLRSGQEQSITFHGQTIAQARAWTAAELLREYLQFQVQDEAGWTALQTALASSGDMDMGELEGVTATLTLESSNKVVALITAKAVEGTRAQSSSTLEVVYEISDGGALPPGGGAPTVMTFNRNLRISNNLSVETDGGTDILFEMDGTDGRAYEILVNGDVEISNNVSGINILRATDSIKVSNNSVFDFLHSNGDILLSNSARATQGLWARGNICVSNNGDTPNVKVRANGSFTSSNNRVYDSIEAAGQSDNKGKTLCTPPASFTVDISGSGTAKSVMTKGNVRLSNTSKITEKLWAEGDLQKNNSASASGDVQLNLPEVTLVSVPKVFVEAEKFNAHDFESIANYVFKREGNDTKVVVRNVNGVADGEYSAPPPGFPAGHPTYSTSNGGTWTFANTGSYNVPPGTLWFEGNVVFSNTGKWHNTFIATGNITTNNNQEIYAPNFASEIICDHEHFPKQFCTGPGSSFKSVDPVVAAIGNYAFMAGSVSGENGPYVGGDVKTNNNTDIYGSVMAGNDFISSNALDIYGFITAQAHRTPTGTSSMSNKTNIILKNLPPTYIPMGGIDWCVGCTPPSGNRTATIQWTRYR